MQNRLFVGLQWGQVPESQSTYPNRYFTEWFIAIPSTTRDHHTGSSSTDLHFDRNDTCLYRGKTVWRTGSTLQRSFNPHPSIVLYLPVNVTRLARLFFVDVAVCTPVRWVREPEEVYF